MLINWIIALIRDGQIKALTTITLIVAGLIAALVVAPAAAIPLETALLTWALVVGLLLVWAVDGPSGQ